MKRVHDRILTPTWSTEDRYQSLYISISKTAFKLPSVTHFFYWFLGFLTKPTQKKRTTRTCMLMLSQQRVNNCHDDIFIEPYIGPTGFHMTSLKFKLQNCWFSWDFIFMMHKSCWQQLTTTYITSWWEKKMNLQWYIKGKLKTRSCNVKVGASVRVWRKYWSEYALLYNKGGVASLS